MYTGDASKHARTLPDLIVEMCEQAVKAFERAIRGFDELDAEHAATDTRRACAAVYGRWAAGDA